MSEDINLEGRDMIWISHEFRIQNPAHSGFYNNNGYKLYPFRTHFYRVDNYKIFLENSF